MSLNIKKQRVHDLAREAAARTGQSQTSAIEVALERYLASLGETDEDAARWHRVEETLRRFDDLLTDEDRQAMNVDGLYDEQGLPR